MHDQNLCSTLSQYLFYMNALIQCRSQEEQKDERLLNLIMTQRQRDQLVLFTWTTKFCPGLPCCQLILQSTDRPQKTLNVMALKTSLPNAFSLFFCQSGIQKLCCTHFASNLHLRAVILK